MSLETDLLLDRRRLKRRLFFWRSFAVLAVLAAVLVVLRGEHVGFGRSHVARLTVSGIISDDRKLDEAVTKLADNANVKALIVAIDSPGGSVAGGEGLHDAIARVAEKKPVVAVMGGAAASAGYMIAVPAARIFAREATLTGSIGVLLETGEVSGLLKSIGVNAEAITSGPLKDQPSFTKPLSPQGRDVLQGLVMDMYDQFVGMVAERPAHGRCTGARAGGWAGVYRPTGPEARPGRCDRWRARRAGVAGATKEHLGRSAGGGCHDQRPGQPSVLLEPGLDVRCVMEKPFSPRSYA